jgi:Photosynthetic reaction centre cytochrome C subunit
LKTSPYALPAAAIALLTAAIFAVTTVAQDPQTPQPPAGSAPMAMQHDHAGMAPTNLKVLPKNLTDEQVHKIMHGWADALGTHCTTCHAADPNKMGANGRPQLNFADDSKPEKATARLMFSMTEDINKNYVSKVPDSDASVTCGTCHRGHLDPEPFVAPPDDHDGAHPPQGAPQGPPTGTAPPTSH